MILRFVKNKEERRKSALEENDPEAEEEEPEEEQTRILSIFYISKINTVPVINVMVSIKLVAERFGQRGRLSLTFQ